MNINMCPHVLLLINLLWSVSSPVSLSVLHKLWPSVPHRNFACVSSVLTFILGLINSKKFYSTLDLIWLFCTICWLQVLCQSSFSDVIFSYHVIFMHYFPQVGVGMCMEGIEQNPVVYELMSEMAFRSHPVQLEVINVLVMCIC